MELAVDGLMRVSDACRDHWLAQVEAFELDWWRDTIQSVPAARMSHPARIPDLLERARDHGRRPCACGLLARAGGTRATDTVHIVPEPRVDEDGRHGLLFLASGVRHIASEQDGVSQLRVGDELALRHDADNEANPDAILLDTATGQPVGWLPDYLVDQVHHYLGHGPVRVFVERANGPDVPAHLRLLCQMEAWSGAR